MKNLLTLLAFLTLLYSCKSIEKQRSRAELFYKVHPEELAAKCAVEFPVKDSVAEPIVGPVKPADNIDYQKQIDSLKMLAEEFEQHLKDAAKVNEDPDPCADQLEGLKKSFDVLQKKTVELQAKYKPCKPDTIPITTVVYRENAAKVKSLESDNTLIRKSLKEAQDEADKWKKVAKERWWTCTALVGLLILLIVLRIKRVL